MTVELLIIVCTLASGVLSGSIAAVGAMWGTHSLVSWRLTAVETRITTHLDNGLNAKIQHIEKALDRLAWQVDGNSENREHDRREEDRSCTIKTSTPTTTRPDPTHVQM